MAAPWSPAPGSPGSGFGAWPPEPSPSMRGATPPRGVSAGDRGVSPASSHEGASVVQLESQLKIMRSDLKSLREMMSVLQKTVAEVRQEQHHTQAGVEREREERYQSTTDLCHKIVAMEQDVLGRASGSDTELKGRVDALESMCRTVATTLGKLPTGMADIPRQVDRLDDLLKKLAADQAEHLGDLTASHGSTLESIRTAQERMDSEATLRDRHTSGIKGQLDDLQAEVQKHCGLNAQALKQTAHRLQQVHGRLSSCEAQGADLHEVKEICMELPKWKDGLEQRMGQLKGLLSGLAEAQRSHAEDLKQGNIAVSESLKSANEKLNNHIEKETKARELYHSTLQERLKHLESVVGQSAITHAEVVDATMPQFEEIYARLAMCEERSGEAGPHSERLEELEGLFRGTHDRHAQELQVLREAHSQVHEHIGRMKQAHADELSNLRSTAADQGRLDSLEQQIREAHGNLLGLLDSHKEEMRNSHGEHGARAEQRLQNFAERHAQTLQEVSSQVEALQRDLAGERKEREAQQEALGRLQDTLGKTFQSLAEAESSLRAAHGKESPVEGRLVKLEGLVQESLETQLRMATTTHSELEQLKDLKIAMVGDAQFREQKISVVERLEYMERVLGDAMQRHDDVRSASEAGHCALRGQLEILEQKIASHAQELGSHKDSQEKGHGGILEQVKGLREGHENLEGTLQGKLFVESKAREALEKWVKEHVSHEKAARESHAGQLRETLKQEREAREQLQETMRREIQQREAHHHSLRELLRKDSDSRATQEKEAREAHHGRLHEEMAAERLERKQAQQELHRIIADMALEPRGSVANEAHLAFEAVQEERAERERQLVSLEEALGRKLQENVHQTAQMLRDVRTDHESLREIVAKIPSQIESMVGGDFPRALSSASPPPATTTTSPPLAAWPEATVRTPETFKEAPGSQTARVRGHAPVLGYSLPQSSPQSAPAAGAFAGAWPPPAMPAPSPFGVKEMPAQSAKDPFQTMLDRSNTSTPTRSRPAPPTSADLWG